MGKQDTHRFFICIAVFATIVALLILVCAVPPSGGCNKKSILLTTTMPPELPSVPLEVCRLENVLTSKDHKIVSKNGIKEKMHAGVRLPSEKSLQLHDKPVSKVTIDKNFFIYDVQVLFVSDHFMVTILMELPPVRVWYEDKEYYEFYPLLNPYIHVVELTYNWGFDKQTFEMDKEMRLEKMELHMVPWESNRYQTMYVQTKSSPLYLAKIPEPIPFSEKELHAFLREIHLLETIPMEEGLSAKPVNTSPVSMLSS